MLRVSKVDWWLTRQRDTGPARPGPRDEGGCVIIRSIGGRPGRNPLPADGLPGACAPADRAGDEDCRRSGRDQRPDGSGPSAGTRALRLHLVLIPPGTRGRPHRHAGHETTVYLVSGEAEVWHGAGLAQRSLVRAGDFVYVPPGAPHFAVNTGDVTSVAVVAGADPAGPAGSVMMEVPRHLARLLEIPVGSGA